MTKFLVGLEKFLHSLTHSFCRHIVKTFTFLYLFLKQQKVLHLFRQHPTKTVSNDMFETVFICEKSGELKPDLTTIARFAIQLSYPMSY